MFLKENHGISVFLVLADLSLSCLVFPAYALVPASAPAPATSTAPAPAPNPTLPMPLSLPLPRHLPYSPAPHTIEPSGGSGALC